MYNRAPPADALEQPFGTLLRFAMKMGLGRDHQSNIANWTNKSLSKESYSSTGFTDGALKKWLSGHSVPNPDNVREINDIFTKKEECDEQWRHCIIFTSSRDRSINKSIRKENIKKYNEKLDTPTLDSEDLSFKNLIRQFEEREKQLRKIIKEEIIAELETKTSDNLFPEVAKYERDIKIARDQGNDVRALRLQRAALAAAEKYRHETSLLAHESLLVVARQHARLGAMRFEDDEYIEAISNYGEALNILPAEEVDLQERYTCRLWVATNAIAHRTTNFDETRNLIDRSAAIAGKPDVYSFSILLAKAADFDAARSVLTEMQAAGVAPNEVTATTAAKLIASVEDASELREFLLPHRATGQGFYGSVFSVLCEFVTAEELFGWAFRRPVAIAGFEAAVSRFRKLHRLDEALRVAVAFPYFQTCRKLFRERPE